jgi:hypothetical protein
MTVAINGLITELTAIPADSDDAALVATNGSGAPGTTPDYIGQFYVDTTNSKLYFAKGTASSADWIIAN